MKRNPEYDHIREQFKDVEDPELKKLLIKRAINSYWKKHNKDKTRLQRMRFRAKYPEKIKAQNKKFKQDNPNYKKEYYQKNKERAKEYWQNRTEEQKKAKAKYNRKWKNERYKNNIDHRLHCVVSSAIKRSLKSGKDGHLKDVLGYTIEELKKHLESQFEDWMTWDNFGLTAKNPKETWQIDHIIPANTFNITSTDSEDFKKCWALENLRPLDSYVNVRRPKDGSDL